MLLLPATYMFTSLCQKIHRRVLHDVYNFLFILVTAVRDSPKNKHITKVGKFTNKLWCFALTKG